MIESTNGEDFSKQMLNLRLCARSDGIPRDFVILIALLSSISGDKPRLSEYTRGHSRGDRCTLPATCAYPKGRLWVFLGHLRVAAAGPYPPRGPWGAQPGRSFLATGPACHRLHEDGDCASFGIRSAHLDM